MVWRVVSLSSKDSGPLPPSLAFPGSLAVRCSCHSTGSLSQRRGIPIHLDVPLNSGWHGGGAGAHGGLEWPEELEEPGGLVSHPGF